METTEKPRLITHPRIILFLGVVALHILEGATWDCHFCFYFKTPMGVTSLLLPATLLLWLWYPGYILSMALSFVTVGLAAQNVFNKWRFSKEDYGAHWFQPFISSSWGFLFTVGLSALIVWYVLASLWQRTSRPKPW